ncbi:hypothetical protein DFQ28_010061 [Apophysomyces sp. BC1034]|nr:hypothetical protein DFQ29_008705 [Apophysomyces sp. BC1021]KAG0185048.1 hypothetical protein DFQ28_010061 [Apophysomyces sp. BC1034]
MILISGHDNVLDMTSPDKILTRMDENFQAIAKHYVFHLALAVSKEHGLLQEISNCSCLEGISRIIDGITVIGAPPRLTHLRLALTKLTILW